jgi:uncharacterized protein YdcH (DUF465 family)
MRDWINKQEKDYKIKIKTLISKTKFPRIPDDELEISAQYESSDFFLHKNKQIKTPSLGTAYLLGQIAISFNSVYYWNKPIIKLIHTHVDSDSGIIDSVVSVLNMTKLSHWYKHLPLIEQQCKENHRKGINLWTNRNILFPHLIFCGKSEKQITHLSISNALFEKLWYSLKQLNDKIKECTNNQDLKSKTMLTITDEGENVKNNKKLRRYREFTIPDEGSNFFGLHVKNFPGSWRMHIYPDYNKKCVYIGYFGKHLPL